MSKRTALPRRVLQHCSIAAAIILCAGSASFPQPEFGFSTRIALPKGLQLLEPDWRMEAIQHLPENITALTSCDSENGQQVESLFIGAGINGSIYKMGLGGHPQSRRLVIRGMSDAPDFGMCSVNGLGVRDLDHDGVPELLAWTSQMVPIGRPRLYVWSITPMLDLRAVARPEIRSSWSHGLGLLDRPQTDRSSAFIAYCGYGEVVEFYLAKTRDAHGFLSENLAWKQVGQLPVSGESVQAADADNDGSIDLVIAAGFAGNGAEISLCTSPNEGDSLQIKQIVNEDGRFGNVRFLVGPTRDDGLQDLIAWWCSGLSDGDCEIIRYRLGPEGIRERDVLGRSEAAELWPMDGQICLADADGDGRSEVWFTTHSGHLWRRDFDGPGRLVNVVKAESGHDFGPIVFLRACENQPASIVFSCGPYLIQLKKN